MSDVGGLEPLPQASVEPPRRTRLSVIWIIPILAAVVAIGIAVQRIVTEGSEERRVGKECMVQCRSRWSPYH